MGTREKSPRLYSPLLLTGFLYSCFDLVLIDQTAGPGSVLRVRHDCVRRVQLHKHLQKMGLIIPILYSLVNRAQGFQEVGGEYAACWLERNDGCCVASEEILIRFEFEQDRVVGMEVALDCRVESKVRKLRSEKHACGERDQDDP